MTHPVPHPVTPGSTTRWTTRTLHVPGARIHHEVSAPPPGGGTATPLALVGHPMGADDFRELADHLARDRTVLLHDPRGFGASPLDDPADDADPDRLAADLVALLDAVLPGQRVDVFGSSGGAVTALALAARHPERVRVVVAHEPPLTSALPGPEAAAARRGSERVVALLHEQGVWPAMGAFMALAGFGAPGGEDTDHETDHGTGEQVQQDDDGGQHAPPPEQVAALERMIGHGLLTVCGYALDVPALRAARASGVQLVLAAGEASGGQLARRCAEAVAGRLDLETTLFPGDHAPWVVAMGDDPAPFATRLREVLDR